MTVSTMVRMAARSAVTAFAMACGNAPVAPAAAKSDGLQPPAVTAMGPNFLLSGLLNEARSTITINPNVTPFYPVGPHWVYIPAGAMCAQGTSYGVGEWDKDCVTATDKRTTRRTLIGRSARSV